MEHHEEIISNGSMWTEQNSLNGLNIAMMEWRQINNTKQFAQNGSLLILTVQRSVNERRVQEREKE
jgi:hypothetical protein